MLQIGLGKKAKYLDVLREFVMVPQPLKKITTVDPVIILQVRSDYTRNLDIQSVVYDIANRTTDVPAQKLKDMMIEINNSKKVKVPSEIPTGNRMSPDSSAGLYICVELCQSARIVAVNK